MYGKWLLNFDAEATVERLSAASAT